MDDLMRAKDELTNRLNQAVSDHSEYGRKKAHAEYEYRVALARKITALRAENQPVTIVNDLARGSGDIALLRLKRDLADATFLSAIEAINNYKLQLRIVESQIAREYGR
jgi:hypothetical protein